MPEVVRLTIPFGRSRLDVCLPKGNLACVLMPPIGEHPNSLGEEDPLRLALDHPIDSEPLEEWVRGKHSMVIITSDHTRAMPSRQTLPLLLQRSRKANPDLHITILVSAGNHRPMTKAEMVDKFGKEICARERIVQHDSQDAAALVKIGTLSSGNELWINRVAVETECLAAEGLIEPHFFAGFSGGSKSVLPGIAGYRSILANHCAEFIQSGQARTGNLDGNPIHQEIVEAGQLANLSFIFNVVLATDGTVLRAFCGNPQGAHEEGVRFVREWSTVPRVMADIVLTSNGGYPLDQNIYQSVKGMSTAESCCKPGGVIIMVAACQDGHGGHSFYSHLASASTPGELHRRTCRRGRHETLPDQWEFQILSRILANHTVILVTALEDPRVVTAMHMRPAGTIDEALELAFQMKGRQAQVVVIPDGVSTLVDGPPAESEEERKS
jgi:nickel-dependent lactate racemase